MSAADARGNPDTVKRLTAIADDECVYDTDDVDTIRWSAQRIEELEADLDALARVLRQILRRPYVDDDNCVWPHGTAQSLDGVMADAVRRHVERKR